MKTSRNWIGASGLTLMLALAACSSTSTTSPASSTSPTASSASPSASADVLGTPKAATGAPLVFGMLNLESGPVTFPEVRAGAEAAAAYVNAYLGGIGGRPIKIVSCPTDGQPATSARCANQILDQHPVAIIGGADSGAEASMPVWTRANLAVIGGLPFTPSESTSPNSIKFVSVSSGDNAAMAAYAGQTLKATSAAVLYTDNSQGGYTAKAIIEPTLKNAGVKNVTMIPVPPSAADLSAQAAAAVAVNPDVIYVETPNACANMIRALQTVGNKAKVMGLSLCTAPPVITAAGSAEDGYLSASPLVPWYGGSKDAVLYQAAMKKFAAPNTLMADTTAIGFQEVINLQAALDPIASSLTTASILNAFKTGTDHPNFLAHPYTCDGKQLAKAPAACNSYQLIYQVSGGANKALSETDWVTAGQFYTGN